MVSHLSNSWNFAVAYIEMWAGNEKIGTGTGFFWFYNNKDYFITNWHNLSGRNPMTGKIISPAGYEPNYVKIYTYRQTSSPDSQGLVNLHHEPIQVSLLDKDLNPIWFEHPLLGRLVDVAVIDVSDYINGFKIEHANTLESNAVSPPKVSQDVFVIGFPFGLIANAPAPLWKRGTIALDPTFDADGLPKMLIDTATREGMSGSVVVARHIIVNNSYSTKEGATKKVLYAQYDLVIGIYSGRYYPDFEKAQIGIVWKRKVIEEIILGKKLGCIF